MVNMNNKHIKSTHTGIVGSVDSHQKNSTTGGYFALLSETMSPPSNLPADKHKTKSDSKSKFHDASRHPASVNVMQSNVITPQTTNLPADKHKTKSDSKSKFHDASRHPASKQESTSVTKPVSKAETLSKKQKPQRDVSIIAESCINCASPNAPVVSSPTDDFVSVKNTKREKKSSANSNVITITVNGVKTRVCSTWAALCVAPLDEKCNFKCTHLRNDSKFPHLKTPICFRYCTSRCPDEDNCKCLHPVELAFKKKENSQLAGISTIVASAINKYCAPTTSIGQSKKQTQICMTWLRNHYNSRVETCERGARCNFAHSIDDVTTYGFVKEFQDSLVAGHINLQQIFDEVYSKINGKRNYINGCLILLGKQPIFEYEPIPSNFASILGVWTTAAGASRKLAVDDKFALFDGIDSCMENRVWALARVCNICFQDRTCEFKKIVADTCGTNCYIPDEEICIHGFNCKRGSHYSGIKNDTVPVFCMEEICGNCTCDSLAVVKEKRAALSNQLAKLKAERIKLKAEGIPTKQLNTTIETVAWSYINTFRKLHFSEFGCKPLTEACQFSAQVEQIFVPSIESFDALKTMTQEERTAYNARVEIEHALFIKENNARKEIAEKKAAEEKVAYDIWYANLIATIDFSNPIQADFINKSAFKCMTLQEYIEDSSSNADTARCFNTWYESYQSISFRRFNNDVKNKMIIWENLGIERRIIKSEDEDHDDEVEEFHIPSEKDNYLNFWAWYKKIPITADKNVVGDLGDLVINAPDLFQEYRNACPSFYPSFPVWINRDMFRAEMVAIFQASNGIDYFDVCRYVKYNVQSSGMTLQEFAKYHYKDVMLWMSVNKERRALNESKFTMDEVLANSGIFTEFYLKGWWKHYNGDIAKFLQSKKEGWKHTASGIRSFASENSVLNAKLEAKRIKQEKDAAMFLNMNKLIDSTGRLNQEAIGISESAPVTKTSIRAKKIVDSDSDSSDSDSDSSDSDSGSDCSNKSDSSDSDSDSGSDCSDKSDSSDSDSDSGSDCSDESDFCRFDARSDFNSNMDNFLKPKKVLPLNGLTVIGHAFDYYVYREQTTEERKKGDVVVRKICVGPFNSESRANNVEQALKTYNKTKGGRGMNTKVVKTEGIATKSADCWNVVYGDTVTSKYENDTSYDWIAEFINGACSESGVFAGSSVNKFTSNISSLQATLSSFRDNSNDSSKPVVNAKATVPVKDLKETKKVGRLSADEIQKRLEDKKNNRQALKDATEIKKAVIKLSPSQKTNAPVQSKALQKLSLVQEVNA